MTKQSIHPPGDKIQKAVRELSLLLEGSPKMSRTEAIEKVSRQFDLSPLEQDFLLRNLGTS